MDLVLEDTDSPSNLAATGQNDVLVRLRLEPGLRNANESARVWLWAASDNLRLYAQNAVECALDLRRLQAAGNGAVEEISRWPPLPQMRGKRDALGNFEGLFFGA